MDYESGSHISEVVDFYRNKSVLITGGSGFVGKVLIEKLLYSCEGIDKIYVLIRVKPELCLEARAAKLTDNVLFSRIKSLNPDLLKKIVLITGELSDPKLGLSEQYEKLLIENVSVVFHVAATVRFNEPLPTAVNINVEGTEAVIKLCNKMKNIKALVHVSTAYCNPHRKYVAEKVYPPPVPIQVVKDFIKQEHNEKDTMRFLGKYPNTYTFTKALAEHVVVASHGDYPVAIVRPSIVVCTYKEPVKGWLDNWSGPSALLLLSANGVHRVMLGHPSLVFDVIPVDIVTNMILVAAAEIQRSRRRITVFNCCSGPRNPITESSLTNKMIHAATSRGLNTVPFPYTLFILSPLLVSILKFILVTIPAFFLDLWLFIQGKPPRYLKMQAKMKRNEDVITFFSSHEWKFQDDNVRELVSTLTPEDLETFYCDPADVDWRELADSYYMGIRKYLQNKNDGW